MGAAPTRKVESRRSRSQLAFGFLLLNLGLVAFGIWCFLWPIRHDWPSARYFAAFWIVIQLVNGVGHPLWSVWQGGYTPGVVTAPVLLLLATYLAIQTVRR